MSIHTLELLEQSDMPPTYARAIAKAIEADSTRRLGDLATKAELKSEINGIRTEMNGMRIKVALQSDSARLEAGLRSHIAELKMALQSDSAKLESEFRSQTAEVKVALQSDSTRLESELRSQIAEVKLALQSDSARLESELRSDSAKLESRFRSDSARLEAGLRSQTSEVKSDLVRWLFLAIMGQTTLFSGIMYFLLRVTLSTAAT
jgi:phage host-nuclease inhibitor protein Gam